MAVLLDTGIVYSYYDRRDSWHTRSVEFLTQEQGELIVPAPVIPEVDHLMVRRLGSRAAWLFYQSMAEGYYLVADLPQEEYGRVLDLNQRFRDLELGFVDAAVIAIAEALEVRRIATTDRRDFGALAGELDIELLP
ncbi:MAG: PIN domain-containing protein [bacterium]|nr:PIN domain-containing protein [bacterium]